MTNTPEKIVYTARATVTGGREGRAVSEDGVLDLTLTAPKEVGGPGTGTNPEQLFAVGFGACFQSALLGVARGRKLDAGDSTITARVGIGPTGHGGLGLQVALDLHAPHLSPAEAADMASSRVTLRASDHEVDPGEQFVLRGRMTSEGDAVAGSPVRVQAYRAGGWVSLRGAVVSTNDNGYYRVRVVLSSGGDRDLRVVPGA